MQNEKPVLPAATSVGRVRLAVEGLDRMLGFYEGVLGMRVMERSDEHAVLGAGGDVALVRLELASGAAGTPGPSGGLYHFALLVPDRPALAGALSGLNELGWPLHGASDHGVSEALYLDDPEGNGIEIYADRPRSSWRWSAGEVWMPSTPLDLRGLLAERDPARETAVLPEGTVVGHVHLHVTDLVDAERFYVDMLGLEVVQRGYPGALFMSAGRYHHHLGVNTWGSRSGPQQSSGATGLIDWELMIPRGEAHESLLERLSAAGYPPEPISGSWRVQDPDGIGLVITGS